MTTAVEPVHGDRIDTALLRAQCVADRRAFVNDDHPRVLETLPFDGHLRPGRLDHRDLYIRKRPTVGSVCVCVCVCVSECMMMNNMSLKMLFITNLASDVPATRTASTTPKESVSCDRDSRTCSSTRTRAMSSNMSAAPSIGSFVTLTPNGLLVSRLHSRISCRSFSAPAYPTCGASAAAESAPHSVSVCSL